MSKLDFRRNPEAAGAAPVQQVSEIVPTPAANLTVECQTTVASVENAQCAAGLPAIYVPSALPAVAPAPFLVDDENIGLDEVKFPHLNLVQKVGEMSNQWTPGQIILAQQAVLFDPGHPASTDGRVAAIPASAPVEITVFGFQKTRFSEKTKGGARGLIVNSEAEVAQVGGTLSYDEARLKRIKLFQPLDTALLFVTRPADFKDEENIIFPFNFGEKNYALALWNLKGTGQTHGATVVRTHARLGHLKLDGKPCFRAFTYTLGTKLASSVIEGETVWYYVPLLKPGHRNSPEFLKFMNEVLGMPA